jgi:hypothetical protein
VQEDETVFSTSIRSTALLIAAHRVENPLDVYGGKLERQSCGPEKGFVGRE